MAPGENRNSAMETEAAQEKDNIFGGPNTEIVEKTDVQNDDYSDEPDETLSERLWGLTEMFPEPVRNATYSFSLKTTHGIKGLYSFSRSAVWIIVSSSVILFAPLIFEVERAQMEDMQRSQQKHMLLGPNTAVSGQGIPMPPIHR